MARTTAPGLRLVVFGRTLFRAGFTDHDRLRHHQRAGRDPGTEEQTRARTASRRNPDYSLGLELYVDRSGAVVASAVAPDQCVDGDIRCLASSDSLSRLAPLARASDYACPRGRGHDRFDETALCPAEFIKCARLPSRSCDRGRLWL